MYVEAKHAVVGVREGRLRITREKEQLGDLRLLDVSHLALFGRITVTPYAVQTLCERDIPITHHSFSGWFRGVTRGHGSRNVQARIEQFASAQDARGLRIARALINGKIRNQRTFIRRNGDPRVRLMVIELDRLAGVARKAASRDQLFGIEGAAARVYFRAFALLLSDAEGVGSFSFSHRNRRPPRDPVNALLSLGYSLLVKEAHLALDAVGLDPYLGMLHQPRPGRPALALDLAEEFRTLIVDSTVATVINTGEITGRDLVSRAGAVALTASGRRTFIAAYERRVDTLITHPTFGYSISYRRTIEVQARLMLRTMMGELPRYRPFVTR